MEHFFITIGVAILLLMFLTLFRTIFGPTPMDRILGVNVIGTKTTVLIVLIGVLYHRVDMFVDIALTYALLNFIASLAAARFFQRHKQVHLDQDERGESSTC
ncbi:MAG: monovalent cation/H+ antiporter complex subunit F [Thermodesulfobacteriota bacterium]